MSYIDAITAAAHCISDWDVPHELLQPTLTNEAARLAHLDSDRMGCAGPSKWGGLAGARAGPPGTNLGNPGAPPPGSSGDTSTGPATPPTSCSQRVGADGILTSCAD